VKSQKLEAMQKNSRKEVEIIISLEEKCEKAIAASEFREQIALDTVDPGRSLRLTNIAVNMAQAEILIKNQEYMNARDALEAILVKDPYNIKAMRMLKNLYEKIYASASTRRYNEYLETMVVNEWNWSEAVLPKPADKPSGTLVTKQTDKSSIASKLSDIFIPRIEFDNTSLNSVVQYLITESKENDTSIEKTGVPIMLQLNTDQIAQIPTITISLDDMPIGEIIRYICQSTGLKYRVEDRAVIISTDITAVMETKFFKVRANIINSIAPATTEDTMTMNAGEDMIDLAQTFEEGGASTTKPSSVSTEQLKAYFSERGVPFTDTDATIAYDRRSGKLIVKNTPENLRRIESLLREIDIETPLVLIETKFVELTQTNLEELGFEYLFSKNINNAAGLDDTSSWQVTQNASTMRTLGTNVSGIPSPVSTVNDRLINNLQLPGFNAGNRFNLSFYLHALSRSQYAEVLSSPKVIATSGTEAVIRMVREEYYPDSWVGPEITITGLIVTVIPAYPEFGESTDVGIRLRVTPTVSPNNYTISLVLHPEVIQRTGWSDYSYVMVIADEESTGTLIMRELSTRDVMTNVKVFDGETLIIGGMIRDNVSAVDDRIPGFGDIPLLGRLARTTNELGTKSNLIVFVTARLISPDGIPIRTAGHTKGLFDFRR
jgi:general secretion pathway protein D